MFRNLIYLFFIGTFLFSCADKKSEKAVLISQEKPKPKEIYKKDTIKVFHSKIKFDDYKAALYAGKLADPNSNGNPFKDDKEYDDRFQRRVKEEGINFAGCYTIYTMSCGAMCVSLYVVNRKTGEIYSDIGIDDGKYGFEYRKDSKLLIANSELFLDKEMEHYNEYFDMKPEFYVWKDGKFQLIKKESPK